MTREEIINGLKMSIDLMLFDPTTGEVKEPHQLNDMDRTSYEAFKGAMEILAQPKRMRGRWIPDNLVDGGYWVCTACKHPTEAFAANVIYNFCPYCGADMREG